MTEEPSTITTPSQDSPGIQASTESSSPDFVLKKSEIHPDEYSSYLQDGRYRFNVTVHALDVSFFKFAMAIISPNVLLPAFATRLGAGNVLIAFIPSIWFIGLFLPSLLSSYYVEQLSRNKPYLKVSGFIQRLPWLLICIGIGLFLPHRPGVVLAILTAGYIASALASGVSSSAWSELIAKAIPQRIRGSFFGLIGFLGNGLAIAGGLLVKWIMQSERFGYPANYLIIYASISVLLVISYVFFLLNREPILSKKLAPERHFHRYIGAALRFLRSDTRFKWLIASNVLMHANLIGSAFFMVYGLKKMNLDDSLAGGFITFSMVVSMLASLGLGRLADTIGHRKSLIISRLTIVAALALILFVRDWRVLYLVFSLQATQQALNLVSSSSFVFEISPEGKIPTYVGLMNTITAPFLLAFSLIAGKIANSFANGYQVCFGIGLGASVASTVILFFLRDSSPQNATP